jgi:hypothetical protein
MSLQHVAWGSQIVLMAIAFCAALAAIQQLRSYKLFELLKFLESEHFRNSRRVVLREIYNRKSEDWWLDPKEGARLAEAASNVSAGYDILARMIEYDNSGVSRYIYGSYGNFFRTHWARSIITNHDALKNFLKHRRLAYAASYSAFTELAVAAEKEAGPMNPPN